MRVQFDISPFYHSQFITKIMETLDNYDLTLNTNTLSIEVENQYTWPVITEVTAIVVTSVGSKLTHCDTIINGNIITIMYDIHPDA